jgi:hypothetical protein
VSVESHAVDDADWRKLLTHPPEPSDNSISRDIWERVGIMDKGVRILHVNIYDTSTEL